MSQSTTNRIPLTQGKHALVDAADFERVNALKWMAMPHRRTAYAVRSIRVDGKKTILMLHRYVLGIDDPTIRVDHIDGDGLNCTRENLRLCGDAQNQWNRAKQRNNTSGYKGVWWKKSHNKWYACIRVNRKSIFLGLFTNVIEAAKAYDEAARKHHGEFARTNF